MLYIKRLSQKIDLLYSTFIDVRKYNFIIQLFNNEYFGLHSNFNIVCISFWKLLDFSINLSERRQIKIAS